MSQRNVRTWKIIKEKEDPISTIEYPLVLWWEVWQDCQRWPARHLDTRRWEVQPILCAPVLIGMFFLGSIQIFFIGFLGEYILSMNKRLMNRPLVVEEERINFDA